MLTSIFAAHAGPSGAKLGGVTRRAPWWGFGAPTTDPVLTKNVTAGDAVDLDGVLRVGFLG
jgi:hypothetical protein